MENKIAAAVTTAMEHLLVCFIPVELCETCREIKVAVQKSKSVQEAKSC